MCVCLCVCVCVCVCILSLLLAPFYFFVKSSKINGEEQDLYKFLLSFAVHY